MPTIPPSWHHGCTVANLESMPAFHLPLNMLTSLYGWWNHVTIGSLSRVGLMGPPQIGMCIKQSFLISKKSWNLPKTHVQAPQKIPKPQPPYYHHSTAPSKPLAAVMNWVCVAWGPFWPTWCKWHVQCIVHIFSCLCLHCHPLHGSWHWPTKPTQAFRSERPACSSPAAHTHPPLLLLLSGC